MPDQFDRIIADLARCHESCRTMDIFGAESHRFAINPPLPLQAVEVFEAKHQCRLPEDYRTFITRVGNGGAGPGYGLFSLGTWDQGQGETPWGDLVTSLSRSFPHKEAWNNLTGQPDDNLEEQDEAEYWRQVDAFDARYYSPELTVGSFPICHMGCALRRILVVTGDEAGNVWCDHTADFAGYFPVTREAHRRASFFDWYRDWLDESLRMLQ